MDKHLSAADRLRRYLLRHGAARFQMTVIAAATGLTGFIASVLLLSFGVESMPIRYAVAVIVAYAVFLFLVRLWISRQRSRLELDALDVIDPGFAPDIIGAGRDAPQVGGGGEFGGGGAGGSWDSPDIDTGGGSWVVDAAASSADAEEGVVVVLPLVLLVGGLLAACSALYAAPLLIAEVLIDVALVSGLYRRLHKMEPKSWLKVAVRRTWLPVLVVLLCVVVGGYLLQSAFPQADSIGDVVYGIRA